MKKMCILLLLSLLVTSVAAQSIVYANLKALVANDGDTVSVLKVEKRTKNHILMTGGADYKISADDNPSLCKYLRKRSYAVLVDSSLYINCKKVRYKKLRFGGWYAPAMWLGGKVYFSAIPLGPVAAGADATMSVMLGGTLGDALAASALVSKRVYYEIDTETGKVDFVGRDKMMQLLDKYPVWKNAYLKEGTESAKATGKYLLLLKTKE